MKKPLIAASILGLTIAAPAFAQDTFGGGAQQQQQGGWGQQPQPQQQPGGYPQQQGYPQQGGYPQQQSYPQQSGYPQQQQGAPQAAELDQLMQMERQDYGVPATPDLHRGQMHAPTPASIPGGQIVTTKGLVALMQGNQAPYLLFDVLGGPETLPGATPAVWLAQPGDFRDETQQRFAQMLAQGMQGRTDIPLVFYCLSTQCWMSYNAALRAINAGYTNVLWYRGGIEAWKMAGLPVQPAQGPGGPQQPPQGNPQPNVPSPQPPQPPGWPQN